MKIDNQQTWMEGRDVDPSFVPTPTAEYRAYRKLNKATLEPGAVPPTPPVPIPLPLPGARVLMWKQDPSVAEIGVRKAYLPGHVFTGPKDARIVIQGLPPVSPKAGQTIVLTQDLLRQLGGQK